MDPSAKQKHLEVGKALAGQMNAIELISQLMHASKGIPRLHILPYNWWNESLHGVARAGVATVFPQAICMAASFSEALVFRVAETVSTEARAKFNESQSRGDYGIYKGLTMWSPNLNIYRDPRWGRGQETYGEDPFLTGLLGTAYIKGLQGDHPAYLKTAACAKHFVVHSGPEAERHSFDARVTKKDLFETYLPAFKRAVQDGGVCGVMGAYNRVNGEACCASQTLIQTLLREAWGFTGYFVSDCGAVADIVYHHRLTGDPRKGAAVALHAGCDLECGKLYRLLPLSLAARMVGKDTLRRSVARLLAVRSSLGMFSGDCPYHAISPAENALPAHEALAVEAAEKGIVLLENNGVLPLTADTQRILVVGYNAENELAYLGNYSGEPTRFIKVPEAVKSKNSNTAYVQGYSYLPAENSRLQAQAVEQAKCADVILFCAGLDCSMEGEENGELLQGGGGNLGEQGDRANLELPFVQQELLEKLLAMGKKLILLNFSGGCIDFRKVRGRADAILQCWYPGAQGGRAIANLLFGEISPSGKLPVTFYNDVRDLPKFDDYAMKNRTYRYYRGEVQYPFGYGLTYTRFQLTACSLHGQMLRCTVRNTGEVACDEVLQLYVSAPQAEYQTPLRSLIAVKRLPLNPGEEKEVLFALRDDDLYSVNEAGDTVFLSGLYTLQISDGQGLISEPLSYIHAKETAVIEKCPI